MQMTSLVISFPPSQTSRTFASAARAPEARSCMARRAAFSTAHTLALVSRWSHLAVSNETLQRLCAQGRRCHRHLCSAGGADRGNISSTAHPVQTTELIAPRPSELEQLAACMAADVSPGDCYLLHGPVGAGKSVFSRAFIRAAAGDPSLTVPSPTFLLQQVYDEHAGPPLHHYDLYRLPPGSSTARLNLAAAFSEAVTLIEWPERLPQEQHPNNATVIHLRVLDMTAADLLQSSSGSSSSPGPGPDLAAAPGQQQTAPSGSPLGGDGEDGTDDEDEYQDQRCRQVTLSGSGPRHAALLARLQDGLELCPGPPELGCMVLKGLGPVGS